MMMEIKVRNVITQKMIFGCFEKKQSPCLVPGDPGENGLSVPRAVVEELRPGGDSVTVHGLNMVVKPVQDQPQRVLAVTHIHVQ